MVIGKGNGDISAVVILSDGELLPTNLNDESVVVYRKGESTDRKLILVKAYGDMAHPDLLKAPDEPVCNYSGDGNPLHRHEDGSYWFYEETWAFERGPFTTYDECLLQLEEYCVQLQAEREDSQDVSRDTTQS